MSDTFYVPIINKDGRVSLLDTNSSMSYEIPQYRFLPNKKGDHYQFHDLQEAVDWVEQNVKPHKIDLDCELLLSLKQKDIRSKFLLNPEEN